MSLKTVSYLSFESYFLNFESVLLESGGLTAGGQRTDICHVLAYLGFIWRDVSLPVVAVISSCFNEAAEKREGHEKNQRQRDRKKEEPACSLRHLLVLRTDLLSTGESLLGCVYMRMCVGLDIEEKKSDS